MLRAALLGVLGALALIICDQLGRESSPWMIVAAGALVPAVAVAAVIDGRDR